ncbi:MAG: hypothetical protein GXY77_16310 [Fibrobacter sp.]|nr:hypothetical protein [Fibrobacter sp.]
MKIKYFAILILSWIFDSFSFTLPEMATIYTPKVVSNIINCDFEKAFELSDSLMLAYPQDPLPSLLKLTAIGMRDMDFEKTVDSINFLETYDKTENLIQNYEETNGISSYSLTLDGISKAIYASFYLRTSSYFAALNKGLDAIRLLKEAKKMDPDNTEANLFLGLYDYGRAELRKKFWWVLFWYPGSKEEGIQKLSECGRSAFITGNAALLSLSEIYIKENQPEKSLPILDILQKNFPESRFVLWGKAKYFEAVEEFRNASSVYQKLAAYYAKLPEGKYNYLMTSLNLAHTLVKSGMKEKAVVICESLLKEDEIKNNRSIRKETEKLLESIK